MDTLDRQFLALAQARTAHTRLVSRAAHEFRTPLAAVRLHAQLMARAPAPDVQRTHQALLIASVDHMTRLVDQLLLLSELEWPQTDHVVSAIDVAPWIAPKQAVWQSMAQTRDVRLEVSLPDDATLHGDPAGLLALLDNVVHNALRHSPAGQTVTLQLRRTADGWEWRCIDHGPGMDAAQKATAGTGFAQSPHGSGLGLTIAQRVTERHGGQIHFEDTPGGGLTVRIELPDA